MCDVFVNVVKISPDLAKTRSRNVWLSIIIPYSIGICQIFFPFIVDFTVNDTPSITVLTSAPIWIGESPRGRSYRKKTSTGRSKLQKNWMNHSARATKHFTLPYSKVHNYLDIMDGRGYKPRQRRWRLVRWTTVYIFSGFTINSVHNNCNKSNFSADAEIP